MLLGQAGLAVPEPVSVAQLVTWVPLVGLARSLMEVSSFVRLAEAAAVLLTQLSLMPEAAVEAEGLRLLV